MNLQRELARVKTYHRLQKLPLGTVTAGGWLKEQLERSKDGMGGHLDELEPEMIATPFINYSSFRELPFLTGPVDPTFAAGWSGEISGTYWTGLVQLAFTLNDSELINKATEWVNHVLQHQESDGYLGSYPQGTDRMADFNAWSSAWCYRALLSYYEATGRTEVMNAVYRGCLWFCNHWKNQKTDYVGAVIIEPMTIVYAYTGDQRLRDFCSDWLEFLEKKSVWQNKLSAYLSDELPYGSMHTVAYGENVKNPAILYSVTGDKTLLHSSENGLKKALNRIVNATGGPGSSNEFLSPPGACCEVEYCNYQTYNHAYAWLAMATGEAGWGEAIERALFNGAEGARKKDERAIAYMDTPNQILAKSTSSLYADEPDYNVYAPCYNVACCPAHSVCLIPEYIRDMIMTDKDNEVYFFCYGPVKIQTKHFEIDIDTLYPFREDIVLHIKKADNLRCFFRIPKWSTLSTAEVNGKNYNLVPEENGFAVLPEPICTGDTVKLYFRMTVRLSKLDDSAGASKFPIVVERGPLLYALPIPEKWYPYKGRPITPLPEGWSWFEVVPDVEECHDESGRLLPAIWNRAIDEQLSAEAIRVKEQAVSGYVWENPPVKIELPLYPFRYGYLLRSTKPQEVFDVPIKTNEQQEYCTLVPYGCTTLRIAYLPRVKIEDQEIGE